jgi:hypothetical protein
MMYQVTVALTIVASASGFAPVARMATRMQRSSLSMAASLDLMAMPLIEELLDVCEPGLKKATLAMFSSCKEIAYKIRTASCDKMACFNDFGSQPIILQTFSNFEVF